jgi:hypothetical protein
MLSRACAGIMAMDAQHDQLRADVEAIWRVKVKYLIIAGAVGWLASLALVIVLATR